MIPDHYNKPVTPWCLERHMESSGNAFVDARRTDAIEYCFRMKDGGLLSDLKKARHCIDAAIEVLEQREIGEFAQWVPEQPFDFVAKCMKTKAEPNQCMGCQAGWPIREGTNCHEVSGGYPGELVACTAEMYSSKTGKSGDSSPSRPDTQ